jgi:hypothetical protein
MSDMFKMFVDAFIAAFLGAAIAGLYAAKKAIKDFAERTTKPGGK